jgi:hypothetical protein
MTTVTDIVTWNGIPDLFGYEVGLWRNLCFLLLLEGECRWLVEAMAVAAITQLREKTSVQKLRILNKLTN